MGIFVEYYRFPLIFAFIHGIRKFIIISEMEKTLILLFMHAKVLISPILIVLYLILYKNYFKSCNFFKNLNSNCNLLLLFLNKKLFIIVDHQIIFVEP